MVRLSNSFRQPQWDGRKAPDGYQSVSPCAYHNLDPGTRARPVHELVKDDQLHSRIIQTNREMPNREGSLIPTSQRTNHQVISGARCEGYETVRLPRCTLRGQRVREIMTGKHEVWPVNSIGRRG